MMVLRKINTYRRVTENEVLREALHVLIVPAQTDIDFTVSTSGLRQLKTKLT